MQWENYLLENGRWAFNAAAAQLEKRMLFQNLNSFLCTRDQESLHDNFFMQQFVRE